MGFCAAITWAHRPAGKSWQRLDQSHLVYCKALWPPGNQFSLARRHGACPQRDSLLSWNSFWARNIIFMGCQGMTHYSDQPFVWFQIHERALLGDYFSLCSGDFISININMQVHYQQEVLLRCKWQDLTTPCWGRWGWQQPSFTLFEKLFLGHSALFICSWGFGVFLSCFVFELLFLF